MSLLRCLSIPLLALLATAGPVYWAFPEGLSLARSLGIVVGWAGCGLLLASLLLMLRETWLSRWLGGLERMYQWHHRVGMAAYVLLLAHPLALAALFLGWRILREDSGLAARPYLVQAAAPVADGMVEITLNENFGFR